MKLFDWVLLLIEGDKLTTDQLQYGFQKLSSTTMCTWLAVETIDYFLRNGSSVYSCLMDMTKAFDLVKHSTLFQKLLSKGLPVIFVRLLIVQYQNQKANIEEISFPNQFKTFLCHISWPSCLLKTPILMA